MVFLKFTILNLFLGESFLGFEILVVKYMFYIFEIMEY
jgi:hypothetical protein